MSVISGLSYRARIKVLPSHRLYVAKWPFDSRDCDVSRRVVFVSGKPRTIFHEYSHVRRGATACFASVRLYAEASCSRGQRWVRAQFRTTVSHRGLRTVLGVYLNRIVRAYACTVAYVQRKKRRYMFGKFVRDGHRDVPSLSPPTMASGRYPRRSARSTRSTRVSCYTCRNSNSWNLYLIALFIFCLLDPGPKSAFGWI